MEEEGDCIMVQWGDGEHEKARDGLKGKAVGMVLSFFVVVRRGVYVCKGVYMCLNCLVKLDASCSLMIVCWSYVGSNSPLEECSSPSL